MEDAAHTVQAQVEVKYKQDWVNIVKERKRRGSYETNDPETVTAYDNRAEVYTKQCLDNDFSGPKETARYLHKYLNGRLDARILDIGGGTGAVIEELRKLAAYSNADGLDPAFKMLEVAKKNRVYKNIFHQFFYIGCGIDRDSYDAVACSGAILPGHVRSECVAEMCDIVKPGGYIVIVLKLRYLVDDEDVMLLRPLIQKLVKEKKVEVMEDNAYDNYWNGEPGQIFVLKKAIQARLDTQ